MVKKMNWLLMAVLTVFIFSCAKDEIAPIDKTGMVDFTVSTSIPHGIMTYASHNGGATNVDAAAYNLRYILEVWTKDTPKRLAYRAYKIVDDNFTTAGVTFSARLLAMDYDFVFWADFVTQGTAEANAAAADLYYKTNDGKTDAEIKADPTCDKGLTDIRLKTSSAYTVSNDARDAFYKVKAVDLRTTSQLGSVTLNRPFGKFRLVSLDAVDGYLSGTTIATSKLQYTGVTNFPAGFNALTGEVNTSVTVNLTSEFVSTVKTEDATVGGNTYNDAQILAFDYIFAAPAQTAAFNISVYDDTGATNQIAATKSISNIPIVANKLTTIIGYFFTNGASYEVIVDDDFDGETEIELAITVHHGDGTKVGSYGTVEDAVAAATASGDVISLPDGIYALDGVTRLAEGVTLKGSGMNATILVNATYPITTNAAGDEGLIILGKNASVEDLSINYVNSTRAAGTPWGTETASGVIMGKYDGNVAMNTSVINCRITGFRNGIRANNNTGITITGNELSGNRYGIQLGSEATGTIKDNTITNNEISGLHIWGTGITSIGAAPVIEDNIITGNWLADVTHQYGTNSYPIDITNNTFTNDAARTKIEATGTIDYYFNVRSSGTFTKTNPGYQATVISNKANDVIIGTSTTITVNTISIGSTIYTSLADAITSASAGATIDITYGTFDIGTGVDINKDLTIIGHGATLSANTPREISSISYNSKFPAIYISGGDVTIKGLVITTKETHQHAGIDGIVITAGTLTLQDATIDGITYAEGVSGVQYGAGIAAYGNSQLTVTNSVFKNINKNAIRLNENSYAEIDNSQFFGQASAYGVTAQNGIVFMGDAYSGSHAATGKVSNCHFENYAYDGETSCAVIVYYDTAPITIIDGGGNTYKDNDNDWHVEE